MISREVKLVLEVAGREAFRLRHEYISTEHLLLSICYNDAGKKILKAIGASIDEIILEMEKFLNSKVQSVPEPKPVNPVSTIGLNRVLERAVNHVLGCGKQTAEIGDILVSVMEEKESFALFSLKKQGISRFDLVSYISNPDETEGSEGATESDGSEKPQPKKDALSQFTTDLNEKAASGRIDPLIGRALEVDRIIHILGRRQKNNPILIGDPGVGKTAVAEGLALAIHEKKVPPFLQDAKIYALDMGGLLAGTRYRGDFEERLKEVIKQLKKQKGAVLFIDEIHTLIGAGAVSGGSMDASNILKPMLTGGELRCIGSTTYLEYKNLFEKDHALSRRFQKVEVGEPSRDEAVDILKGLRPVYEEHHGVVYKDEVLECAVDLSRRFIHDRFLPDKAIDVMDEAGSAVKLRNPDKKGTDVTRDDIEKIVSGISKVPVRSIGDFDRERLRNLETELKAVIFDQEEAVTAVASAVKRSKAGLGNPLKPIGSFLFFGPTGTGKTELCRKLSEILGVKFIRFDMSEYMEKHTVSRLIGAPPGYVGFDQGGLLTDGVIRDPHAVILLDEIEKAHPDVYNILLQVMDYGTLTDHNGRKVDFRNVILVMTSNAGAHEIASNSIGFGAAENHGKGRDVLNSLFTPEFRNRLDAIVGFNFLGEATMRNIVSKFLSEINTQLAAKNVKVELDEKALAWLCENGFDKKMGARPMARLMEKELKQRLTEEILFGKLSSGGKAVFSADEKGLQWQAQSV